MKIIKIQGKLINFEYIAKIEHIDDFIWLYYSFSRSADKLEYKTKEEAKEMFDALDLWLMGGAIPRDSLA